VISRLREHTTINNTTTTPPIQAGALIVDGPNIHIRAAYRYLCQSLSKREDLMELIKQMPAEQESSTARMRD
jgi:hypothetical protein